MLGLLYRKDFGISMRKSDKLEDIQELKVQETWSKKID